MKKKFFTLSYPFILYIGTFLFIFLFFYQIHPIYPYDTEDWLFVSGNSTNVPEFISTVYRIICSDIAMYCIYPIIDDVSMSLGFITAFWLATVISIYITLFYQIILRKFKLQQSVCLLLTLLLFVFHFLCFRLDNANNQFLFYSHNLANHYYYTIPNVLNSILVLLLWNNSEEFFFLKGDYFKKFLFLVIVIFILLCNVCSGVIFSSFIFAIIIINGAKHIVAKISAKSFFCKYSLHLIILILWGILVGYIISSNSETNNGSLISALSHSYHTLKDIIKYRINITAIVIPSIGMGIFAINELFVRKSVFNALPILIFLCSLFISIIFLIVDGTQTSPYYIKRAMSFYAIPFFFFLAGFTSIANLLKNHPKFDIFLPILLLYVVCNIEQRGKTFQDVQTFLFANHKQYCYEVMPRDILSYNYQNIQTIINADHNHINSISIYVPHFQAKDNWPLTNKYGESLSTFLNQYNLTSNKVRVSTIYDNTEDFCRYVREF